MRKKLVTLITMAVVFVGSSLSALAAPQTMPDGGVFDPDYYAQQNPDVVAVLGTDANVLYQHYLTSGRNEGRLPYASGVAATPSQGLIDNFDAAFYASTYPDIVAILGNDPNVLYKHYISAGKAEGRMPNSSFMAAATDTNASGDFSMSIGHGITFTSPKEVTTYSSRGKVYGKVSPVAAKYIPDWLSPEVSVQIKVNEMNTNSCMFIFTFYDAQGFMLDDNAIFVNRKQVGSVVTDTAYIPKGTVTIKLDDYYY